MPEKLLKIVADIDVQGHARLTRLTVLKKWLQQPERLSAFAVWVATRANLRKRKVPILEAEVLSEARKVLSGLDHSRSKPNREAARKLHDRLRSFQNEYRKQQWGPVRMIRFVTARME